MYDNVDHKNMLTKIESKRPFPIWAYIIAKAPISSENHVHIRKIAYYVPNICPKIDSAYYSSCRQRESPLCVDNEHLDVNP